MKLSEWVVQNDVCYQTAWNLHNQDKIPDAAIRTSTGSIVVRTQRAKTECIIMHERVAAGWIVIESTKEIGSRLNNNRSKITKLLTEGLVTKIVVTYKARLAQVECKFIKILRKHTHRKIAVVNRQDDHPTCLLTSAL